MSGLASCKLESEFLYSERAYPLAKEAVACDVSGAAEASGKNGMEVESVVEWNGRSTCCMC